MARVRLTQTNDSGYFLQFAAGHSVNAATDEFWFQPKNPHLFNGIQVAIAEFNPTDVRQMRLEDGATQITPGTWQVSRQHPNIVQFKWSPSGWFVLLAVLEAEAEDPVLTFYARTNANRAAMSEMGL